MKTVIKPDLKLLVLRISLLFGKMVFAIVLITLINSCKKDSLCNCLRSAGDTVTEKRNLTSFTSLLVERNVAVDLIQDSICYAKITCGKHLMDGIVTEVKDGKLDVSNINRCNWSRSYKNEFVVEVHCKELINIEYAAAGNLTMLNQFNLDSLYIESTDGSGSVLLNINARVLYAVLNTAVADITINGNSKVNYFFANAQGFFDAGKLNADYVYMRSNTANYCKVNIKNQLDAEIEATGNIYYTGNPLILNLKQTGSGKLIKSQ